MTFLKAETNKPLECIKNCDTPEIVTGGQWGPQSKYSVIHDGEVKDWTTGSAFAIKALEEVSKGQKFIILKKFENNKNYINILPPDDIQCQPQNLNLPTGIEQGKVYDAQDEYAQKQLDIQDSIMKQLSLKCSCMYLANRDTKKEDVIKLADYFLDYLHGKKNPTDDLPF